MNDINNYLKYVEINGNIINVCSDCSDEKYAKFQKNNGVLNLLTSYPKSKTFFVKSRFVDNDKVEHMWVEVNSLIEKDDTIIVKGTLANDPVLVENVSCRDTVEVSLDNICNFIADNVSFMPLV